jgi:hypothetical protein
MTQPPPPHLELLGAPELRPFESALADAQTRWKAEVARHSQEHVVFTDQRLAAMERSAARD